MREYGVRAEVKAEKKVKRQWVRYTLWGLAIFGAALLVTGTLAALFWCK